VGAGAEVDRGPEVEVDRGGEIEEVGRVELRLSLHQSNDRGLQTLKASMGCFKFDQV
jgi:hypothetical protein